MDTEHSGIQTRGVSILEAGLRCQYRKRSRGRCLIYSWMVSSGNTFGLVSTFLIGPCISFGRGSLKDCKKLARPGEHRELDWAKLRYRAVDVPNHTGPYEERYRLLGILLWEKVLSISSLESRIGDRHEHVELPRFQTCRDRDHMEQLFDRAIARGGEGLILRDPAALWQADKSLGFQKYRVRSSALLPLAQLIEHYQKFRDAEAVVVRATADKQWECELYVFSCPSV